MKRRKHRSTDKEWAYNVLPASIPFLNETSQAPLDRQGMGVQRAARLNTFSVGINGFVHERPAAPPR